MFGGSLTVPPSVVFIGQSVKPELIHLRMASRHGCITGATGTGTTVTLQGLAEGFSDQGIPVFCVDVRGDLSGLAMPAEQTACMKQRAEQLAYQQDFRAYPVIFLDLFGRQGRQLAATLSELGPLFLSYLLRVNDLHASVIHALFHIAHSERLRLLELADLRNLIAEAIKHSDRWHARYGVDQCGLDCIARALVQLEAKGADHFLGRSVLQVSDILRTTRDGHGYITLLATQTYVASVPLYVTFQLFLVSELVRQLPREEGLDKPKLIFFFVGSENLFRAASKEMLSELGRILGLSTSRGVGIYFIVPSLADIPDRILTRLDNRIVHGSYAPTGAEKRSLSLHFRRNPQIDMTHALGELSVGEALVSTLNAEGQPTMVERTFIKPPNSRLGPLTEAERQVVINTSPLGESEASDRELLQDRLIQLAQESNGKTPYIT